MIRGTVHNATQSQFEPGTYNEADLNTTRAHILSFPDTRHRYDVLKSRVDALLEE
ncbi:MAG: hypothetical protein Q7R48_03875 [bacterium]|nr:hypothetical protein [bacterium]